MSIVVVGKNFKVDFGEHVFKLEFHSETQMTWTALGPGDQPTAQKMTVTISRTPIRPNVFMVYWSEPALGSTVVHVQDFENGKVWTNITMPNGKFVNMVGTLTPLDAA